MKKLEENDKKLEKQEKTYSKDAVLKSKKFAEYRDVFQAWLDENKCYTMKELEDILQKFSKKKGK